MACDFSNRGKWKWCESRVSPALWDTGHEAHFYPAPPSTLRELAQLNSLETPCFQGFLISQARILEWAAISAPNPGIEAMSPALARRFFTTEPPGKALETPRTRGKGWELTASVWSPNQHPNNWLTGSCQQDASSDTRTPSTARTHTLQQTAHVSPRQLGAHDVSSWLEPPQPEKVRNFEHFKALPWEK